MSDSPYLNPVEVKCPYQDCQKSIKLKPPVESAARFKSGKSKKGYSIAFGYCPKCDNIIVLECTGNAVKDNLEYEGQINFTNNPKISVIYPK